MKQRRTGRNRHPATWLAGCRLVSPAFAARANTRPIITTAGPATAVAARRCGRSATVAAMTVSSRRVALITATAGGQRSRQLKRPRCSFAAPAARFAHRGPDRVPSYQRAKPCHRPIFPLVNQRRRSLDSPAVVCNLSFTRIVCTNGLTSRPRKFWQCCFAREAR